MKLKLFTLCLACISSLSCQTAWQWAMAPDTANYSGSSINDMSDDNLGNILITGSYANSLAIAGATVPFTGASDCFTGKINKNGALIWLNHGGGSGNANANGVCSDNLGNIYSLGLFSQTFSVSGSVLTDASGKNGIYLLKHSPSGNLLWAKNIGSVFGSAGSITNKGGHLFVSGIFKTPTSTPFTIGTFTFMTAASSNINNYDFFLAKLDTGGTVLSASKFGGSGDDFPSNVCVSTNGDISLAGSFTSSLLTIGSYSLTGPTNSKASVFVCKIDQAGTVSWAKKINEVGYGVTISLDAWNNVYMAGSFKAPFIIVDNFTLTTAAAADNGMLIKFDPVGNALWAKSIGGGGVDNCISVCSDNYGGVYVSGSYQSTSLTIGSFSLVNNSLNGGNKQLFIAQYNGAGNLESVLHGGGQYASTYGWRLLVDQDYNLIVGGVFSGPQIDFGSLTLYGKNDNAYDRLFLAKAGGAFTGIRELTNKFQLTVYPVPSKLVVTFNCESSPIKSIELFDLTGKNVKAFDCFSNTVNISINDLAPGVYMARITTQDKQNIISKIIKQD